MQVTRRTWIDESKPKASIEEENAEHEALPAISKPGSQPNAMGAKHLEHNSTEASLRPSADIYDFDATLQQRTNGAASSTRSHVIDGGTPDDDELDDLLAEDPGLNISLNGNLDEVTPLQGPQKPKSKPEQLFEDDEEALREMDMW